MPYLLIEVLETFHQAGCSLLGLTDWNVNVDLGKSTSIFQSVYSPILIRPLTTHQDWKIEVLLPRSAYHQHMSDQVEMMQWCQTPQPYTTKTSPTKYRIGHIGRIRRIGNQSIACCSGVGAALHQGAPAYLIECSGSCLRNYIGLFCLVKINAHIHSFIVICWNRVMTNSTARYRHVCVTASVNFNQRNNKINRPIERNNINPNEIKMSCISVTHYRQAYLQLLHGKHIKTSTEL